MPKVRWIGLCLLAVSLSAGCLGACSGDGRPSSLVSENAGFGQGGGAGGQLAGISGSAGQPTADAGTSGSDAGAAGEASFPVGPVASFPRQLQVDVACGTATEPAELLIRNDGPSPLIVTSAQATPGYTVDAEFPLRVEALSGARLLVSASTPKSASAGDTSTGMLTFVTNELESATHEVHLDTTVFGARLEFTDGNGTPLKGPLPLTYSSSSDCPDRVRYRVRNSGNLTVTLLGPNFPAHLGGRSTGASGRPVAPGDYVELDVSGNSSTDGACSGGGELSFTVQGSLCSALPKLSVTWPQNVAASGCSCVTSK